MNTHDRQERETIRMSAIADLTSSLTLREIGGKYGVSAATVSRWRLMYAAGGADGLKRRRTPGRPARIPHDVVADIWRVGPQFYGLLSDDWTGYRQFAKVVERETGKRYDINHLGSIIKAAGLVKQASDSREVEA